MADEREIALQQFRQAQRADRLHLLTVVTPFRASQDRFVVIEQGGEGALLACVGCKLSAPLDQGQRQPLPRETLASFLRALDAGEAAWGEDAVPEGSYDGTTIIIERVAAGAYASTHMVAPRSNSPHARLMRAWVAAFAAVEQALR